MANDLRRNASDAILKFTTDLDLWRQNLFILQSSKNPQVIHFTSTNLTNILTRYVNSISASDRCVEVQTQHDVYRTDLRKTLLGVMAELGPQFWDKYVNVLTVIDPLSVQVRNGLIGAFCRLQKLCWFDKDTSDMQSSQTLVEDVMPFLKHSLAHSIIGTFTRRTY